MQTQFKILHKTTIIAKLLRNLQDITKLKSWIN